MAGPLLLPRVKQGNDLWRVGIDGFDIVGLQDVATRTGPGEIVQGVVTAQGTRKDVLTGEGTGGNIVGELAILAAPASARADGLAQRQRDAITRHAGCHPSRFVP